MSDSLAAALKETERAIKKQKLCAEQSVLAVESVQHHIAAAKKQLSGTNGGDVSSALQSLHGALKMAKTSSGPAAPTKDLHTSVGKLGRAIDRSFVADICRAPVSRSQMNQHLLDSVIVKHLLQMGRFDLAKTCASEAAVPSWNEMQSKFSKMHEVLQQVRQRNVQPALEWLQLHREELTSARQDFSGFEMRLHSLRFMSVLEQQGALQALLYRRKHNEAFHSHQDATRLMGSLCYANRLSSSPYSDLVADSRWEDAALEFSRQCCGLMGLALESPLLVAVAAGSVALPTLLKLADILVTQGQELSMEEGCLPVEVDLGPEFVFHSIFACPVSKHQSTPENPPMLLPCGHVLCKVSISKIAKNSGRNFKCPYCPRDATQSACKQIVFPEVQS